MQPDIEQYERKAAECDEFARRVRDPAAQRIFQRAARRWRGMARDPHDSDARLLRLMRLLEQPSGDP
jgi:hypothetical protein